MTGDKLALGAVAALALAGLAKRRGSSGPRGSSNRALRYRNCIDRALDPDPRSRTMRQLLRRHALRQDPDGPLGLDVFAGAGGFGLGAESAGVRTVGMERNRLAVRTAKRSGLQTIAGDVSDLAGVGVPVDVLIGGPPCQPFSSAGKGRGRYDPREGFGLFLDVVDSVRPRRLVAENVMNFLALRYQDYRDHIMGELAKRYPYTGHWVLNAKDFGVPQNRERVFIWASDEDLSKPKPKPGTRVKTVAQALPQLQMAGYDAIIPFQVTAVSRPIATRASPTVTTRRNLYAVAQAGLTYRGAGSIPTGPGKARLLTPKETLILQGFPEGFDPVGNKEQQQCQIGNAVPPPLAAAVVAAVTKGLRPRRLEPTEILDSLTAADVEPLLLEPRPLADEALLGVMVDPSWLNEPGVVAVYDVAKYRELTGKRVRPGRHPASPVLVDFAELKKRGIPWREWIARNPSRKT